MVSSSPDKKQPTIKDIENSTSLEMLTLKQILMIDQLLQSIGQFGEIHLIVSHGELRFINKVESYKFQRTNIDNRLEDPPPTNET